MNHKSGDPPLQRRRFSLFPSPLSRSLEQLVKPVYKKHGFAEHRLLAEWNLIAGAELARYSMPQKLTRPKGQKQGGTLYVLVASARALEMQHMEPLILERIAVYFGYPAVARLSFVQTSSLFSRKEAPGGKERRPPPDEAFAALAAACEDEPLRAALQSLARAIAGVEN